MLFAFVLMENPQVWGQDATPDPKAPLQMALSSPFALTAKPLSLLAKRGKWFPVAVTLSNTGDPVAGEVRLQLIGSSDAPANDFVATVDLPTNARKVVWLYGRLERPGIDNIQVSFAGRGFKTLDQRVPLQEPSEGQRVLLTVSDVDSGLSAALRGLRGSGLSLSGVANPMGINSGASQGPLRPLETVREGVPDRWIGLEIADMVILGDFPHAALAPPQIAALRGYVAGGGNLLALGGANAQRLSSSPLNDLWPATITGSAAASAQETAQIVQTFKGRALPGRALTGADKLGGSPLVAARGALKSDAQPRLGTRQQPLFSFQDVGAGRVLLLGFDPSQPPFNGWSGQVGLWRDVFGAGVKARFLETLDSDFAGMGPSGYSNRNRFAPPGYNNGQGATSTEELLDALGTAQQRRTPPVSQIAWFLALYVFVLVPLNYAILRFIDRRELAWISIPVIVAAFSIFAYSTALSIRGKTILTRQVDIVQSTLGSKQARADSLLWLFSPRSTTYTLESGVPSAAIADYANQQGVEQGAFSVVQPVEASSFRAQNAPVRIWVDRAFRAQSVPDWKGGVSRSGNRISNNSPFDLHGVVWVQNREARSLGTLKKGASLAIPTRASESAGGPDLLAAIERASKLDTTIGGEVQRNGIPDRALRAALGENFGVQYEGAFLIGWSKKTVAPLSIGTQGADASELTLFVFRAADPSGPRAASKISASEAIVKLVSSQAAGTTGGGIDSYECLLPDAAQYLLQVRGTGGLPSAGSTLPASSSNATVPVPVRNFEVYDARQNDWQGLAGTIHERRSPAGGWDFSATIERKWAREPERLLKIRVIRDNSRSKVSSARVMSAN